MGMGEKALCVYERNYMISSLWPAVCVVCVLVSEGPQSPPGSDYSLTVRSLVERRRKEHSVVVTNANKNRVQVLHSEVGWPMGGMTKADWEPRDLREGGRGEFQHRWLKSKQNMGNCGKKRPVPLPCSGHWQHQSLALRIMWPWLSKTFLIFLILLLQEMFRDCHYGQMFSSKIGWRNSSLYFLVEVR